MGIICPVISKAKVMKQKNTLFLLLLLSMVVTLNSCEVIKGIFNAGVYTGIFLVVLVAIPIVWLIARRRK